MKNLERDQEKILSILDSDNEEGETFEHQLDDFRSSDFEGEDNLETDLAVTTDQSEQESDTSSDQELNVSRENHCIRTITDSDEDTSTQPEGRQL
ncbi:unnamed protein product [Colias eurytheme]|nr:unnamed protein product [Colias eurytheme]